MIQLVAIVQYREDQTPGQPLEWEVLHRDTVESEDFTKYHEATAFRKICLKWGETYRFHSFSDNEWLLFVDRPYYSQIDAERQ